MHSIPSKGSAGREGGSPRLPGSPLQARSHTQSGLAAGACRAAACQQMAIPSCSTAKQPGGTLGGPQGLPETTPPRQPCLAPALPATRAAAEHPTLLRSREKRAQCGGLSSHALFSGLRGFCCSSARGRGCAFLLVLEHLLCSSPEGVVGRACCAFRIDYNALSFLSW